MDTARFTSFKQRITENCSKVIVGKEDVVEQIIICLIASGHILLEDLPGTGKTMLLRAFAKSIGSGFKRIQFTPDLMPSDLTGIHFFNQKLGEFEFRPGPLFTNLVLADEINRATPRSQSALLEVMEEKQITVDGVSYAMKEPYLVMASQNPLESYGTFPLPEAQMDRFLVRLSLGYPTAETELGILRAHRDGRPLDTLKAVTTPDEVIAARNVVRKIHIDESLETYVVSLVQATRTNPAVRLAASPRAGINLIKMAQACAYVAGRDFVNPDDIQHVFYPVMEHRVFAKDSNTPGASRQILEGILKQVRVPK